MPKAYSYIRFSTLEQLKGDSLRRQTELSEKFALENNLELDKTLNLNDFGISAYDKSNITKGALGIFLKLIEQGEIDCGSYLLVESLDRLSRAQLLDALHIFIGILKADITIVTLADNIIYTRQSANDNWQSLMMSLLIMSRATEESATKSKRIRAAWDQKREKIHEKKLTARCPYWLKLNDERTSFVTIPDRVEIVKRIFNMAKEGFGNSLITRRFNEQKVPTFSKQTDGWQPTYIQKVLRNKAVYGEFNMKLQRNGEITSIGPSIENYYPTIIEKDEWLLVNQRRSERKTKGGASKGENLSNVFSGLLFCGYCNGPMVLGGRTNYKPNKPKITRKYVGCSKARRGLGCHFASWNYEELEAEILKFCHSLDFSHVLGKLSTAIHDLEAATKNVLSIENEIATCKVKLSNLIDAIEKGEGFESPTILNKIKANETALVTLNDQLLSAIEILNKIKVMEKNNTNQYEDMVEVINKLKVVEGTDLHDLRVKLSSQIKRVINKILLNAVGPWKSPAQRHELEISLKKMGLENNRITNYLNEATSSDKNRRYLTIVFKNNETLTIGNQHILQNLTPHKRDDYLELVYKNLNSEE